MYPDPARIDAALGAKSPGKVACAERDRGEKIVEGLGRGLTSPYFARLVAQHADKSGFRSDLMRRAQDGDRSAYDQLLREALPMVRTYFRKRLANDSMIEDLCQQTLLRIHLYRATFAGSFDGWMYTVARNVLFDQLGARAPEISEAAEEREISPAQEIGFAVHEALANLSPESRRAVLLIKQEGLDLREAAALENVSVSAMKVRVHRAMKVLRDSLWVEL